MERAGRNAGPLFYWYRTDMALFKPGHVPAPNAHRPKGSVALKERIAACAEFMNKEGWLIAMDIARARGKDAVKALELLANYGFGKPIESMDITTNGESLNLTDYLNKGFEMPHPSQLPPTQPHTPPGKYVGQ